MKFNRNKITRPSISAGVVTHCTDDKYHAGRLEIVKTCIQSIRAAGVDELIIWDNGSTQEFRNAITPLADTVVLSPNIGLDNAKRNLFEIARGIIFCYSDDDILHADGWLEKQLEILLIYPNVGVVSGSPQRDHFHFATSSNMELAQQYGMTVKTGRLIPDEILRDYAESVGLEYKTHEECTKNKKDTLLEYKGVKAWAHGHHMQFVCYREKVKRFFLYTDFYMSAARPMDEAMDKAGFMRLTTYERTVRHMGNSFVVQCR